MTWWMWMIVGLVLLGAEVAIPGSIVMLFFGVAALIVGAVMLPGAGLPLWTQLALFSALSIAMLLTLRGPLLQRLQLVQRGADKVDSLVGAVVTLDQPLEPGATGKVQLRGSSWSAVHNGPDPIAKGERCVVERVEGLTLFIREDS